MTDYKQGDIVVISACPEAIHFEIMEVIGEYEYRLRDVERPNARSMIVDEEFIHNKVG